MTQQKQQAKTLTTQKRPLLVLIIGLTLTLATGAVYGRLSHRWGPTADMMAAAEHLQTLPKTIGDWRMVDEQPLGESTARMLECAGYVGRRYVNGRTGNTVTAAFILGPPGPIAVHTPEICFSSRAYDIEERRQEVVLTGSQSRSHSFWAVTFRSKAIAADELRVYYAWTAKDAWIASTGPRYEFAAQPMLFKIQLAAQVLPSEIAEGKDPCRDFLKQLVALDWTPAGT